MHLSLGSPILPTQSVPIQGLKTLFYFSQLCSVLMAVVCFLPIRYNYISQVMEKTPAEKTDRFWQTFYLYKATTLQGTPGMSLPTVFWQTLYTAIENNFWQGFS